MSGQATGSAGGRVERVRRFVADYTDGLRTDDVRRLFERDLSRAYQVLTRDQPREPEREVGWRRWLHRAKVVFLGLSFKLSPARRMLFAVAMLATLLGLVGPRVAFQGGDRVSVSADFSAGWFLIAIGLLAYLLAVELVDRVLVRDELEVARGVQRELMPSGDPPLPGYRVAHSWRTANEVGGDYYDFLPLEDGRVAVLVGDASGHGMAAGLVMAVASAAVRSAVELDPRPAAVLDSVNKVLCRSGNRRAFMSLFYGLLDPASGDFEYACAGHPFPLLRRASGEVVELGEGGFPLGLRKDLAFTPARLRLETGDLLLLYSDGLPESLSASGEAFGFPRLRDLARAGGGAQSLHDAILAASARHRGAEPLADDLTVVAIERLAALPALPSA